MMKMFKVGVLLLLLVVVAAMAETAKAGEAAVHIVYMEQAEGEEAEAYHLRTLKAVLGSEEAAKKALLYSYKTVASGFSAKLTAEQVAEIKKQPGVLRVAESEVYQLHKSSFDQ